MNSTKKRPGTSVFFAFSVFLLIATSVATADEGTTEEIAVRLPLETFAVRADEEDGARFTGGDFGGAPGLPGLPSVVFRVLLPPNTDLRSAHARLEKTEIEDVAGKWNVPPYPPAAHVVGEPIWPKGVEIREGRNVQAYSTNAFQPQSFLGLVKGHPVREWKILLVRIYPFRHNPVTQQIQKLRTANLIVSFKTTAAGTEIKQAASASTARIRQRIRESTVNFDVIAEQYK